MSWQDILKNDGKRLTQLLKEMYANGDNPKLLEGLYEEFDELLRKINYTDKFYMTDEGMDLLEFLRANGLHFS